MQECLADFFKSASIGSSTSLAAVWTTRSRIVGMPSGRSSPSGFGMDTRRTGSGRYAFETSTSRSPASHLSRPNASIAAKVIWSVPGASGHPAEPLVSYQINRQFSGWIPPSLVIRAFGAHCRWLTSSACPLNWASFGPT
jgi:hypothetical protein